MIKHNTQWPNVDSYRTFIKTFSKHKGVFRIMPGGAYFMELMAKKKFDPHRLPGKYSPPYKIRSDNFCPPQPAHIFKGCKDTYL